MNIDDADKEMAEGFGAALAIDEEIVAQMNDACTWCENEDGNWFTGCGNAFIISEGTPSENKMAFCCYCGRPLQEVLFQDEG